MITYLPHDNFWLIAQQLHDRHLSESIKAATEVLRTVLLKQDEHPCTRLWSPFWGTLDRYQKILHEEWRVREGRKLRIHDRVIHRVKPSGQHPAVEEFSQLLMSFPVSRYEPLSWGKNLYQSMQWALWRDNPEHYNIHYRIDTAKACLITDIYYSAPATASVDPLNRDLLV